MLVGGLKILKKSFALWSHAALYVIEWLFLLLFVSPNPSIFPNFVVVNDQHFVEEPPFR